MNSEEANLMKRLGIGCLAFAGVVRCTATSESLIILADALNVGGPQAFNDALVDHGVGMLADSGAMTRLEFAARDPRITLAQSDCPVATKDCSSTRYERALLTSPQEWLNEIKGYGGDWLSEATDNLPEGPLHKGWGPSQDSWEYTLPWRDLDVYRAYLSGEPRPKIAPWTSVSENLRVYES